MDVLEAGGSIERETRLYDPDRNETRSMRSKEFSEDYRYFPDPDLLPLNISQGFVDAIKADMPELPEARRQRYQAELQLSEYDARWLSNDPDIAEYFDDLVASSNNWPSPVRCLASQSCCCWMSPPRAFSPTLFRILKLLFGGSSPTPGSGFCWWSNISTSFVRLTATTPCNGAALLPVAQPVNSARRLLISS